MDLLLRVQEGLHRSERMDFMDILKVPAFVNTTSTDPRDWWDASDTNMWTIDAREADLAMVH